MLRFRVSDTGIGIPAERIGQLVTEFQQADGTIAREFGGTGLGLSITKKFVEMHGGHGSRARSGPGPLFFLGPVAHGGGSRPMSAKTILYIEDNEVNRRIVQDLLKRTSKSEERRVGKECRSQWSQIQKKKNHKNHNAAKRVTDESSVQHMYDNE